MSDGPRRIEVHLRIPTQTLVKVLITVFLAWIAIKLWPEVVFLAISLLLAVALDPIIEWMVRRRLTRGTSVLIMSAVMIGTIVALLALVMPPLAEEMANVIGNFAAVRGRVLRGLPHSNVALHTVVEQMFLLPSSPAVVAAVNRPLFWGQATVTTLLTTFVVLTTTLYLLLDGRRLYAWLLAYVPRSQREKMALTVPEVSKVVYAYVRGQFITSSLFAAFVAITLWLLNVPGVLALALLAAACDVIPLVGIVVATMPAAFMALSVTPYTSGVVVGAYGFYHLFEAYFIVPRVYGSTMRLSALAVLLALIVGSALQGLLGAVLVLPLVAAYPIIERIWLGKYLGHEVVADHSALAEAMDVGSDAAVEAVLQGQKHVDE